MVLWMFIVKFFWLDVIEFRFWFGIIWILIFFIDFGFLYFLVMIKFVVMDRVCIFVDWDDLVEGIWINGSGQFFRDIFVLFILILMFIGISNVYFIFFGMFFLILCKKLGRFFIGKDGLLSMMCRLLSSVDINVGCCGILRIFLLLFQFFGILLWFQNVVCKFLVVFLDSLYC